MKSKFRAIIFFILTCPISYSQSNSELGFFPKNSDTFTKVCEGAYISEDEFVSAAHCLALLNALYFDFEINPSVKDGDSFYPVLDFSVSSLFRSRLDQGIHDDLALVKTTPKKDRQTYSITPHKSPTPEIIVSTPHFKNESGRVLFNKEEEIIGVLSRKCKDGGSVFSSVSLEDLEDLRL